MAEYELREADQGEDTWGEIIVNCFNGYMLAVYLRNNLQRQNIAGVSEALRMYCNLSEFQEITGKQLIVVRPCDDLLSLLHTFTNEDLMANLNFGHYVLDILNNLLRKDPSYI